ncbi:MAG: SUF system NifU family Fe-S cluster assembly protein [Euryarchaeota archaeon]|nr:SUF system NifU family Fe-S cluster assembly protein [Euryarchaeota archaeon]
MSDLSELYEQVILDHNNNPRNFRKVEDATNHADGFNPLCGDKVSVYLDIRGDVVKDVGFVGEGCAISKASASLMTQAVKGKRVEEVERLFKGFHALVTGQDAKGDELGKLLVFSRVSDYPVRVKCASLSWHTLKAALEGKQAKVSTE